MGLFLQRLWEWPKVFIEAEFHAVWLSPDNQLVDVSPFPYSKKILFLSDPNIEYTGKQINNIRQAITDDPLIHQFINVSNQIFEKQNEGDLAYQHGLVSMPAHILLPLFNKKRELLEMLYAKYLGPNDLCFCNSGKKLKKCHGRR
jgi:hypothetical protein